MVSTNDGFGRSPVLQHRVQLRKRFEIRHRVFSFRLALARRRAAERFWAVVASATFRTHHSKPIPRTTHDLVSEDRTHVLGLRLLPSSRIEKCVHKSARRLCRNTGARDGIVAV